MPKLYLSEKELHDIIFDYNNGMSMRQITTKYHHDKDTLKKYFKEHNIDIQLRNRVEALQVSPLKKESDNLKRKYYVQDDYFSTQNSKMAYILGFLMADGNVSKTNNRIQICLAEQDSDFLEIFHNEIGGSPIAHYEYSYQKTCRWECISAKIKKDLASYGIIPNKTGLARIPETLEEKYYPDFIRGYFDGDGSIWVEKKTGAVGFEIVSHNKEILEQIINFFYSKGIPIVDIKEDNRSNINYSFRYRKKASKMIYDILYYDSKCLYMQRKFDKFTEILKK